MDQLSKLREPPGPGPEDALAVAQEFMADPVSYFAKMVATHGSVFKMPLGPVETVFLNDAETAEKVLRLDFAAFGMSQQTEGTMRPLLGRSMPVVADHRYWEELHAIIMPMFTPAMLRRYFEQTVRTVAEEVEHLAHFAETNDTVPLLNFVRQGIFTALARTLFVRGVETDDVPTLLGWFEKSNDYMSARYLQGEAADADPSPRIVAGREALAQINAYVYRLIAYRRANLVDTAEDMLDVLLAARKSDGSPLDDEEIRDNVVALFFGGQETTPSVITWAFGLLSANPEKRERVLEEVDRVLEGRAPTFQDLAKLEYTEMVLDEALRLYPPFSFVGREALEDVELGGYLVRKGTPIGFVGWTIHRDPRQWPDPESFEPERHVRALKSTRGKCAFVAFGYGQRKCTGERVGRMEGLLMLAMVSQRYLLDREGGGLSRHQVINSIKPSDGLPVHVRPRP